MICAKFEYEVRSSQLCCFFFISILVLFRHILLASQVVVIFIVTVGLGFDLGEGGDV